MVGATLLIMADKLLGVLLLANDLIFYKLHKSLSVRPVVEPEVDSLPVVLFLDACALLLHVVLEDQLLQEKECALVLDFLSDLDLTLPEMRRVSLLALIALQVLDDELDHKGLLQHGAIEHLLLNCHFDLESSGVWFCPDESSVDHFDSLQTLHMLQAERQQLRRFKLASYPGRSLISVALFAMMKLNRLRDPLSDIDL